MSTSLELAVEDNHALLHNAAIEGIHPFRPKRVKVSTDYDIDIDTYVIRVEAYFDNWVVYGQQELTRRDALVLADVPDFWRLVTLDLTHIIRYRTRLNVVEDHIILGEN